MVILQSVNKNKWLLLFCFTGFLLNFTAYYPGFLTFDSIEQYKQALSGHYNDWHPPMMAVWWRFLNHFYNGPQSFLFFQLGLFWCTCYLLMKAFPHRLWHIMVALVMTAPFVQNFAGYIIKDAEMAFSWLLAFAILLRIVVQNRKITVVEWILCFIFLLYGTMVRTNALPGVIPLCLLLSWVVYRNNSARAWFVSGISILIMLIASQVIINKGVIKAVKAHPEDKLFLHDLSGIFVVTHQNVFPPVLYENPGFDTGYIRKNYTTATFDDIIGNKDNVRLIDTGRDITHDLFTAWVRAVKTYPVVYLSNRYDGFLHYLRIKNRGPFYYYIYYIEPNKYGFELQDNKLADVFIKPIEMQGSMPYMKPWFWLLFNIVLLFFIRSIKDKGRKVAYVTLLSSSLLYLLPGFLIYPTNTDFRYFYWNCIACSLALCILVIDRRLVKAITMQNGHPA